MLFVSLFWHLFLLEELQHFLQTTSQGNKVLVFIFWISCPSVRVGDFGFSVSFPQFYQGFKENEILSYLLQIKAFVPEGVRRAGGGWFQVLPQWVFFPSPDCPTEGFFLGTWASLFCECLMGFTEKSLQNRCKLPGMCGPRGSHSLTSPHPFSANSLPTPGDFCWPHQPPGEARARGLRFSTRPHWPLDISLVACPVTSALGGAPLELVGVCLL